jgi:hypothetical protein
MARSGRAHTKSVSLVEQNAISLRLVVMTQSTFEIVLGIELFRWFLTQDATLFVLFRDGWVGEGKH